MIGEGAAKFVHTRPNYRYTYAFRWQACRGHDRVGPPRMFFWQAVKDLPEEAEATFLPENAISNLDCHSLRLVGPYRIAPTHNDDYDYKTFGRSGWSGDLMEVRT